MKKSRLLNVVITVAFSFIFPTSHAALVDNGGGLVYDTVLGITWAQPVSTSMTWPEADPWAAGLTLGGVSGWRLPYLSVAAGAGPTSLVVDCSTAAPGQCHDNELGYMFYHNLNGISGQSIFTSNDPNLALFPTLQSVNYWSGTLQDTRGLAWRYDFNSGQQDIAKLQTLSTYAWAVHDGNVKAVPLPPAIWLFGSGLLGLVGITRYKTAFHIPA